MAYSLKCADSGSDCAFAVTTSTEDELMKHVQMHASVSHPELEMSPETLTQMKSLVRTVWPSSWRQRCQWSIMTSPVWAS